MVKGQSPWWIGGQSGGTTGNEDLLGGGPAKPLEAAIQGPFVRTYSWRCPGLPRGREQSRQEPMGLRADSWLDIIILNPSAHDGSNRPGERTALADGF